MEKESKLLELLNEETFNISLHQGHFKFIKVDLQGTLVFENDKENRVMVEPNDIMRRLSVVNPNADDPTDTILHYSKSFWAHQHMLDTWGTNTDQCKSKTIESLGVLTVDTISTQRDIFALVFLMELNDWTNTIKDLLLDYRDELDIDLCRTNGDPRSRCEDIIDNIQNTMMQFKEQFEWDKDSLNEVKRTLLFIKDYFPTEYEGFDELDQTLDSYNERINELLKLNQGYIERLETMDNYMEKLEDWSNQYDDHVDDFDSLLGDLERNQL